MASKKTGPKPLRVKISGDWKAAVGKAISKERPADGWPVDDKKAKPKKPKGD